MSLVVLNLDLTSRHLIVVENGQERVWPVDTLPFSENWHKLPASCHLKIFDFLQNHSTDYKFLSTKTAHKSHN